MRAAALFILLTLPAAAADPFEGLKRLDRVAISDKDGDTVRGIVRSVVRGRLSLQIEGREGVIGSLVFERKSVAGVEKLGTATEEELKAISELPPRPREGFAEPERPEPKPEPIPPTPRPVLEAFPPGAWSAARRDEVAEKDTYLRSSEEREFIERFGEWSAAMKAREREEGEALLARFPPGEDWNDTVFERLRRTTAVIGRELTNAEREFVDSHERWKAARLESADEASAYR
jgi:hypothetical protein